MSSLRNKKENSLYKLEELLLEESNSVEWKLITPTVSERIAKKCRKKNEEISLFFNIGNPFPDEHKLLFCSHEKCSPCNNLYKICRFEDIVEKP